MYLLLFPLYMTNALGPAAYPGERWPANTDESESMKNIVSCLWNEKAILKKDGAMLSNGKKKKTLKKCFFL